MPGAVRVGCRTLVALVEQRSCRKAAVWIIEGVEGRSGVGGELGGVNAAPVDDFGVGVAKWTGQSRGGGRVERARAVGVEGG